MGKRYSPDERREFTDANRAAWDEAAPVHARSNQTRLLERFSTPGYCALDDHCLDRLSEIGFTGKSIAQLGCNNGRELLSLRNLGAGRCVGFDASTEFIDQARQLADVAGHADVEFVTTDIYELASRSFGPFDIVLSTIGVLGWMPDIGGFFEIAARLTRPHGHVFVEEIHPVLLMYEEGEGDQPSYLEYSYFKKEPWVERTGLDYYTGSKYQSKPNYAFPHTLADIVMAAIDAGLTLRHFAELDFDISRFCKDLEAAEVKPPLGMTMVWQKL